MLRDDAYRTILSQAIHDFMWSGGLEREAIVDRLDRCIREHVGESIADEIPVLLRADARCIVGSHALNFLREHREVPPVDLCALIVDLLSGDLTRISKVASEEDLKHAADSLREQLQALASRENDLRDE